MGTPDQHASFKKGERIISKGEDSNCAYMITSGRARVFLEEGSKEIELATLEKDAIFGETALFSGETYGAHVEAAEDIELFVITPAFLEQMIKSSDPIIQAILKMLIERLRTTNEALLKSETREFMDLAFI